MIKGGTGGANTSKGLLFESQTSLSEALQGAHFNVEGFNVYDASGFVGELAPKHQLYKFLETKEVDWRPRISKKLLPDDALYVDNTQCLHIFEKKWQEVDGSVDEKLQTVGFKLRQYNRLVDGTGMGIKFIYILNDWFTHPKYADVLDYIHELGASYHFNSVPLEELELN